MTAPVGDVIENYREQTGHALALLAGLALDQPLGRPMPGRYPTIRSLILDVLASTAAAYGQLDLLFDLAQGGYCVDNRAA